MKMFGATTALACAALLGIPAPAAAQAIWRIATPFPESVYHTKNARMFVDEVNEKAAGKLKITLHTGGSLFKLTEVTRAVQSGQVQGGEIIMSILSNEIPLFEADGIPLIVTSWDGAWDLYQATKPMVEEVLAKRGLTPLYSVSWPGQGFYTKVPINVPADFKGKKLRAPSVAQSRFATALGMEPTVIDSSEISQAFITGLVDVNLTSSPVGLWTSAWDYTKYFYDARIAFGRGLVFVNKKAMDALPPDVQKIVMTAAATAEVRGWEMGKKQDEEALAAMRAKGMQVVPFSPAVVDAMRQASQQLITEWEKRAGPEVSAAVARIRK